MESLLIDMAGWAGFSLCTLAYLLLNVKILRYDSAAYQLLNALGGLGLLISAKFFNDMPNFLSNLVWLIIAVYGLFRYAKALSFRKKTGITDAK